ncbi:MAG: hypothetical protein ORN51_13110, partial [Akkermansiaceae bacterium]|nr:hypothetical protein [Akkermansiaceae bacterium]
MLQRSALARILLLSMITLTKVTAADPQPQAILHEMQRVADWQIAHPSSHPTSDWTQAPFYLGLENLSQASGDARYLDAVTRAGQSLAYGPGLQVTHADDHAVLQAWLELYALDHDRAKLQPSID